MEKLKLVRYNDIRVCEKVATFTYLDTNIQFIACFREWDLPGDKLEEIRIKEGTIIEASISFHFIFDFEYKDVNEKLTTIFLSEKSSYAEIIVEITRCTEYKDSYWAKCNLFKNDILLNFEDEADCKVGDIIKIRGEFFIENEKLGISFR